MGGGGGGRVPGGRPASRGLAAAPDWGLPLELRLMGLWAVLRTFASGTRACSVSMGSSQPSQPAGQACTFQTGLLAAE